MNDEDSFTSTPVDVQTTKYLWEIGKHLASTCPVASRFYLYNLERNLNVKPKLLENSSKREFLYCNHCGNLWSPGNHRVRIRPPPSPNQHIKKLLKWEADKPWKLNNRQKRKLKKFKLSSSKIIYTCFLCKKNVIFPGKSKPRNNPYFNQNHQNSLFRNMKRKKGDLYAGLYITSTTVKQAQELSLKDNSKPASMNTSVVKTHSFTPLAAAIDDISRTKKITDLGNKCFVTKASETLGSNLVRKPKAEQSMKHKSASVLSYSTGKKDWNTKKQKESNKEKRTLLGQNIKKKTSIALFLESL